MYLRTQRGGRRRFTGLRLNGGGNFPERLPLLPVIPSHLAYETNSLSLQCSRQQFPQCFKTRWAYVTGTGCFKRRVLSTIHAKAYNLYGHPEPMQSLSQYKLHAN